MSREWKPGDVAVAEIDGKPVRLMRAEVVEWVSSEGYARSARDGLRTHTELIDPRPLVVIDPEDREAVERFREVASRWSDRVPYSDMAEPGDMDPTDAMQAALRELVAPPKPDEPTGLGAAVEAINGNYFVRVSKGSVPWQRVGGIHSGRCDWSDIAVVRVLSEGVDS